MKMIQLEHSNINRILVIKPRAIGDVLLSTSVLPGLRREFPNAQIDFLVEKFAAPVLDDNPFLDNVISFDTKSQSSLSIIMQVRKNKYDLVIDLFANPRTAIITMFSGAKFRVGYPFKWRRLAYNILVPPRNDEHHNMEFNLDALRKIGIPAQSTLPLFRLNDGAKDFANEFIKGHQLSREKFITINVGGGWEIKRWKADKFVELCRMIKENLHFEVVVLYGPSEAASAEEISRKSNIILAPQTSLHEMGAIMKESLLLVTNDSGPMHIAAALDVPTLAIFGPTNPRAQGPCGNISEIVRNEKLICLECNLTKCPIGNPCMKELEAGIVFDKLLKLISKIEMTKARDLASRQTEGVRKLNESI
jgi:lipopolysaccharide heptosyltransferase II